MHIVEHRRNEEWRTQRALDGTPHGVGRLGCREQWVDAQAYHHDNATEYALASGPVAVKTGLTDQG